MDINYKEIFEQAKKDIGRVINYNFSDVKLNTKISLDGSFGFAINNTVFINIGQLEEYGSKKSYNICCHELVHIYLQDLFDCNNSFAGDNSPLFCMIVVWLNNNGFKISQNYNIKSKFKNNIDFINIMKTKDWSVVDNFINDFNEYITNDKKVFLQIDDNIRKSKRNKEADYGSGIIHLSNSDFKLSDYKNFIEQFK